MDLAQSFSTLASNTLYHWRGRILRAPATGPIPSKPEHGPWRRLGGRALEADIRVPEPGVGASLAVGISLLGWLARRRS